jgi:LAO/AO transport system kinase
MSAISPPSDIPPVLGELWQAYSRGERRALARLLTLAGEQDYRAHLYRLLSAVAPSALVVAITGAPGAGKSTLIGKLIPLIRHRGQSVAVLACDPRSPLTGGALLGDRIRMPTTPDDTGTYIRSLAAPPGRQGLAENLDLCIALLERFAFDWILVETVGVGQSDVAIRDLVDCLVLLIQPESGDEIQWEKAGLLEVADLVVVSKGDLPGASRTAEQLRQTLNLPGFPAKPVLLISAAKGSGLAELLQQLAGQPRRRHTPEQKRQRLLLLAQEILAERFQEHADLVQRLLDEAQSAGWDDWHVASQLINRLASVHAKCERRTP